jgi:DNA-binding XRE family transcriptional regulator
VSAQQAVADNPKKWRLRRAVSVSALARTAGVAKSTISEIEREGGNPSLETPWAVPLRSRFPRLPPQDHASARAARIMRADESVIVFEQAGYVSRLLAGWQVDGEIEIYVTTMEEGGRSRSVSHGADVIEHVLIVEGRAEIEVSGNSAGRRAGRPNVLPSSPAPSLPIHRRSCPDCRHSPVPTRPPTPDRARG